MKKAWQNWASIKKVCIENVQFTRGIRTADLPTFDDTNLREMELLRSRNIAREQRVDPPLARESPSSIPGTNTPSTNEEKNG